MRTFEAFVADHQAEAYGIFGPPALGDLGAEEAALRERFAETWERRSVAAAEMAAADRDFHAAVRACRRAGANVTQLAVLAGVTRPTIYAWLRGCS